MIRLSIGETRLGDGSLAHDVIIYDDRAEKLIVLPAISRRDATALIDKVQEAIEAHTNETVRAF